MKKGFLRIVAVIMVVLMTAVYMPVAEISDVFATKASAASYDGKLGGNVKWSYNSSNKTLVISGSGNMSSYGSTPEDFTKYRALLVTSIYKQATKIEIQNGVTNIGNNVFRDFAKVTSVSIPASVTSIGTSAFEGCSALSSVTLPANLKTIGNNAFKGTKFSKVTMPDTVTSIGTGVFSGVSGLKITCNFGTYAYDYCVKNSISCTLPANTLYIDTQFDAAAKQVSVDLKIAYNKAQLNAANFTLSFNNAVSPLTSETVYETKNGVVKALVYSEGKMSFAVMAETYVPYSSSIGVCEYDLGSYTFKINGQADKAEFLFTCDTLLINETKAVINGTTASEDLHFFTEKVTTPATCKVPGVMTKECSVCGLKSETPVDINAANHANGTKKINEVAADCGNAGYSGDDICVDCGALVFKGSEVKATENHDYKTEVTEPTCTTEGFTKYTCKVCSYTYDGDKTPVKEHDYSKAVTDPTCTEGGFTVYTCNDCGYSYTGDNTPAAEHRYKTVVTEPTCTDKGYTTYTCEDCFYTYQGDETPVKAHEYEVLTVKEPTCTEGGFTTYKCKSCEATYNADETAVKAHDYMVVEEVKATCITEGYTKYECIDCGHTNESEKTPVKAHDYDAVVTEASCQAKGFTTYTCKACKASYVADETPVADHKYEAAVTEATCTEGGFTEYTCSMCADAYKGDFVNALGHDFDANGECSRCDETTVVSISFKDSTGYVVDEENKVIIIRKTVSAADVKGNIASGVWNIVDETGNAVADDKAVVTGASLKSENGTAYAIAILGDVNKDGRVNAADARVTLRSASKIEVLSGITEFAADCDGKAKITAADARIILRVGAKIQTF